MKSADIQRGNVHPYERTFFTSGSAVETYDPDLLSRARQAQILANEEKIQDQIRQNEAEQTAAFRAEQFTKVQETIQQGVDFARERIQKAISLIPKPELSLPTVALTLGALALHVAGIIPPASDAEASLTTQPETREETAIREAVTVSLAEIGVTNIKDIKRFIETGILPDSVIVNGKTVIKPASEPAVSLDGKIGEIASAISSTLGHRGNMVEGQIAGAWQRATAKQVQLREMLVGNQLTQTSVVASK